MANRATNGNRRGTNRFPAGRSAPQDSAESRSELGIGMTKEQERLLHRRLREAIKEQPEILILRALLLQFGDVQLVAPPRSDPAVPLLC